MNCDIYCLSWWRIRYLHRIVRQYVQYNVYTYIYTENYQLSNILNGYDYVSRYPYTHIYIAGAIMTSSQRYANVKNCIYIRVYYIDYVNTFVIWIIINANIITWICKKFSSINKWIVMHTLIFIFQHQLTCNNILS